MMQDDDWNSKDIDKEDIMVTEINLNDNDDNGFGGIVKNEAKKKMMLMRPSQKKKVRIKVPRKAKPEAPSIDQ